MIIENGGFTFVSEKLKQIFSKKSDLYSICHHKFYIIELCNDSIYCLGKIIKNNDDCITFEKHAIYKKFGCFVLNSTIIMIYIFMKMKKNIILMIF